MITERQKQAMALYAGLMEEIKIRDHHIGHALKGGLGVPVPLVREFCYLQLRMTAELIALACLTAHGDIEATQANKFQKAYASDRILEELAALHPNFYPEPMAQDRHDRVKFTKIANGFLTRSEVPDLVGRCGDRLHRGSMKKLMSGQEPFDDDYADIREWVQKIRTLLRIHWLRLIDGDSVFICLMANSDDHNRVQIALAATVKMPGAVDGYQIGVAAEALDLPQPK